MVLKEIPKMTPGRIGLRKYGKFEAAKMHKFVMSVLHYWVVNVLPSLSTDGEVRKSSERDNQLLQPAEEAKLEAVQVQGGHGAWGGPHEDEEGIAL